MLSRSWHFTFHLLTQQSNVGHKFSDRLGQSPPQGPLRAATHPLFMPDRQIDDVHKSVDMKVDLKKKTTNI